MAFCGVERSQDNVAVKEVFRPVGRRGNWHLNAVVERHGDLE
jgi:hypothetical protein